MGLMKLSHKEIHSLLLQNKDRDIIVLEIGANVGRDTSRFLHTFEKIKIFCFEPDPRCIAKFEKRINDNRCILIKSAVSDKDGEENFYLSSGSKPGHKSVHINSSSLLKPKNHLKKYIWCTFNEQCKVPVLKLDTWIKQTNIAHIDFIWADLQGAESKFIRGAKNILKMTDYLYTEYNNNELYEGQMNLEGLLKMLPNFKVCELFPSNILFKNTYDK